MGAVIGDLLPLTVGVAISPVPIIAVLLMLLSQRPGATSTGFAIGWVVGIALATTVFVVLYRAVGIGDGSGPSPAASWIKIALGVLLLGLAVRKWRTRPEPGQGAQLPTWMAAITEFNAVKASGLGVVLAAANPKNLVMAVTAGTVIGTAALPGGQMTAAVLIYTILAGCTVLIPVIGFAVAKAKVRPWLDTLRKWLEANNTAMMTVLLVVLGMVVLGKGVSGLG